MQSESDEGVWRGDDADQPRRRRPLWKPNSTAGPLQFLLIGLGVVLVLAAPVIMVIVVLNTLTALLG